MNKVIDEPAFRNKIRVFRDRSHAGRLLAQKLFKYQKQRDALVLAVPAGA